MASSQPHKAFLITEILELILLETDTRTLLTSAQRVCRKWHFLIQDSSDLQAALFFKPTCRRSAGRPSQPTGRRPDADRLSQGQRQLLCIARAMLAGKRIILIDEASSNVDERSERLIGDAMREKFASCIVIAVAHRLGAVVDFDRVAVMDGGRLLEWDNPRDLISRFCVSGLV
ncbi:ABC transporter atnG [Penicillium sp. CMV-2018d]|nr:ABC transporter atnG [Penicillium sp. CMV-2018d]